MNIFKKVINIGELKQNQSNIQAFPARCAVTGENFDISLQYEKGKLTMISGKRTSTTTRHVSTTEQSKGLKTIELSNGMIAGKTYHCPICGNKDIVRCGKCHRITCYDGKGSFRCAYCGNSGKVSGVMQSLDVYSCDGLKKDGTKEQIGMKYYPGDK